MGKFMKKTEQNKTNKPTSKTERKKGIRTGPAPLGGSCERGKASAPWEVPSLAGRSARTEEELQRLEGEGSNQFAEGKAERDRTDGPCRCLALPSLRCSPAGAGRGWVLRLGLQRSDPGRGLGLAAWRQLEGARVWCSTTKGVWEEARARQKGKVPLFWDMRGEGQDHHMSFFIQACGLRWQGTAYLPSKGRCEPLLPSKTPDTGADSCCLQGSHSWAPTTVPISLGACAAHHLQGSHAWAPTTAPAFLGMHLGLIPAHPLSRG